VNNDQLKMKNLKMKNQAGNYDLTSNLKTGSQLQSRMDS